MTYLSLFRGMLENSEGTVVSSQGSSNLVDSSSQQMETDYDDLEPPLTISRIVCTVREKRSLLT